jgi:hypothetical protein
MEWSLPPCIPEWRSTWGIVLRMLLSDRRLVELRVWLLLLLWVLLLLLL